MELALQAPHNTFSLHGSFRTETEHQQHQGSAKSSKTTSLIDKHKSTNVLATVRTHWLNKVHQTPQLFGVVLKRGATEKHASANVQSRERQQDACFAILQPLPFINNHERPTNLQRHTYQMIQHDSCAVLVDKILWGSTITSKHELVNKPLVRMGKTPIPV